MHCEVSTLPATTALGQRGSSIEPGGTTIESGRRQPALSGIGSSINVRNTYRTAATVTARGALKLLSCCAEVPVKSTMARTPRRGRRGCGPEPLPVVELVAERTVGEPADRPPRARLGVVLDVLHVGVRGRRSRPRVRRARARGCRGHWRRAARGGRRDSARVCAPDTAPAPSSRRSSVSSRHAVADDARRAGCSTPSSSMRRLPGGIEPGVTPPMSA